MTTRYTNNGSMSHAAIVDSYRNRSTGEVRAVARCLDCGWTSPLTTAGQAREAANGHLWVGVSY